MYLEARRCILSNLCCLLNCKAFGGSRVKTRRCISRQEGCMLSKTCVVYLIVSFGGSRVKTRGCISRQEDVF